MTTEFDPTDPTRFEEMYRDDKLSHGLPAATPWDIGGPQPVVQQLVALGAIKGEVLDPGTGPGHHAIYYASKGYSATGIDGSEGAIKRARANAQKAGVTVNFELADATKLEGLDGRFDTVVDCAFYHTFSTEPELQRSYAQALRRATKPGARLYMFEFGAHDVNGFTMMRSLSENDFHDVLPAAGWRSPTLDRRHTWSTSVLSRSSRWPRATPTWPSGLSLWSNASGPWSRGWSTAGCTPRSGRCTPPGWTD